MSVEFNCHNGVSTSQSLQKYVQFSPVMLDLLPVTMCSCQSKSAVSALGVVEGDPPVHGVHVGIGTFRQQETHQFVVPRRGCQL